MLVPWRVLSRSTVVHSRRLALSAAQPRPYAFHVGVSFMGKPDEGDQSRYPYISRPFLPTHPVIPFRERMLAWKKESTSGSAGQDFFYVQEVCGFASFPLVCILYPLHYASCADDQPFGGAIHLMGDCAAPKFLFGLQGLSIGIADGVGGIVSLFPHLCTSFQSRNVKSQDGTNF
jgi:hypothetical protein